MPSSGTLSLAPSSLDSRPKVWSLNYLPQNPLDCNIKEGSQDLLWTFGICVSGGRVLGSAFLANQGWHAHVLISRAPIHGVRSLPQEESCCCLGSVPDLLVSHRTSKVSALPSSVATCACSLIAHPHVVCLRPESTQKGFLEGITFWLLSAT